MNTCPSTDEILEGVIMAIEDELLPAIGNPKAQATAVMIQSMLQGLRQLLPVHDRLIAEEHNDMLRVLREVAERLGSATGDAADRIRTRAADTAARDDVAIPADPAIARTAHRALGRALEDTMIDLDELQRAGVSAADEALQVVRGHLGPRYLRDVQIGAVGEGFIGRG